MKCPLPDVFKTVCLVDFEFISVSGESLPDPVCLVGHEFRSGRTIRLWRDQFEKSPPYPVGPDSLFVSFAAAAELFCHLSLGWPLPERVLDLYFEFRHRTNGVKEMAGKKRDLLTALTFYGLSGIDAVEKKEMIDLVLRGGPWSREEQAAILDYCESDVIALRHLLPAMLPEIRLQYALLRGRYAGALTRMESVGVPIDVPLFDRLQTHWEAIQDKLIAEIDQDYGVFEGRTFKQHKFAELLIRENIPWPSTETGQLDLRDDTFKDMATTYPKLQPLRQLRKTLSGMRLHDLIVGQDGFNRCFLRPYASRTGRNQPSNSEFIFGPAKWLRGLIKPPGGYGISYLDWGGQEFGTAAALSQDKNMMVAYLSGDAYLWFGKKGGLLPPDATKKTHQAQRDLYKTAILAINYGIGRESLARLVNVSTLFAQRILDLHHELFADYWRWSDRALNHAMLFGWQQTVFDWVYRLPEEPNPRSIRDFHMQANGAELLRLAVCLATENGVRVCAPVHDALLIMAPLDILDCEVARMRAYMAEASRVVLNGFELFTDSVEVRYPDRYCPKGGETMWNLVMRLLEEVGAAAGRPLNLQPAYLPV
jgi:DNA polymerase I